jgi:predicted nucleic acid-binding protein
LIYIDTSVALAQLFAEDRIPPAELWEESLVTSRLLEYELWTRLHARGLARSHSEPATNLLSRIAFLELAQPVLARAREPFPLPVRTLDALHLATMSFLRENGQRVSLASYDARLNGAAKKLGIDMFAL